MLLHVTDEAGWAAIRAEGRIGTSPFLHLCTEGQLGFVLGRFFAGRVGLVVLEVDGAGLDVRWEASEPGMDPFPHLYGWAGVDQVRLAKKRVDGAGGAGA